MRFWVVCFLCLLLLISVTSARKNKKKGKRLRCMKSCNKHLAQVCASDGKTYDNTCLFKIAKCEAKKRNVTLKIITAGRCPSSVKSRTKATKKKNKKKSKVAKKNRHKIRCGSDGKTYRSRRQFRIARRKSGGSLKLKHKGECKTSIRKLKRKRQCKSSRGKCQKQSPVCGSDGVTYKNCCAFLSAKKKLKKPRKGKLRVVACPLKTTAKPVVKTTAKHTLKTTEKPTLKTTAKPQ